MYRYELKFVLEEWRLDSLRQSKLLYPFYRAYPDRIVTSLYLDTPARTAALDNIAGIGYREKYRIRWYNDDDSTTAETKIKDGRVGTKKTGKTALRSSFLLSESYAKLEKAIAESESCQSVFKRFDLQPAMFVRYRREYYTTNYGLRMTIDTGLRFKDPDSPQRPSSFSRSEGVVIEFKFDPKIAVLCKETLAEAVLLPTKNSKYIRGLAQFGKTLYI